MKKVHVGLLLTGICVFAFVGGVTAGVVKNKVRDRVKDNIIIDTKAVASEEESVVYEPKVSIGYKVICEGSEIVLFDVFDDESFAQIDRVEFNKSVLPLEDILMLEEGMMFETKDEALMMIENFVS